MRQTRRVRKRQEQEQRQNTPTVEEVIGQIQTAFQGVQRRNGSTLHAAGAMDGLTQCDCGVDGNNHDSEVQWDEVPEAKLEYFRDALFFLDDEGFRFYIPAFMIHSLQHPNIQGSTVVFVLQNQGGKKLMTQGYTREQALAIVEFLRFMKEHNDCECKGLDFIERWANTSKFQS